MACFLRECIAIAVTRTLSHVLCKVSHLPTRTSPPWSRRSAGGSSACGVGWDTWRRARPRLRPQAMPPCVMTRPNSPGPWRPRCSSASPLGSGLASRSGASARALAARARRPRSRGPAAPACRGFPCMPTPRSPAHRRDQLERLIRYTARGAVSLERLTQDANGDLVYTFTHPWSDGTIGIRLSPLELLEKLTALVPLPRVHLGRYGGCLAPHSHLRGAIIPTPRQQGVDEPEASTASPRWSWARRLKGVFALAMARCPCCQQGSLRILAALTHGEVIRQILRHLKLAVGSSRGTTTARGRRPPARAACCPAGSAVPRSGAAMGRQPGGMPHGRGCAH